MFSKIKQLIKKSKSNKINYFIINTQCCGDEVFNLSNCRYDIERLGCNEVSNIENADLMVLFGGINDRSNKEIKLLYEKMKHPKFVISIGRCTSEYHKEVPIDVFVPGCPPRPEGIMYGILKLKDKICE